MEALAAGHDAAAQRIDSSVIRVHTSTEPASRKTITKMGRSRSYSWPKVERSYKTTDGIADLDAKRAFLKEHVEQIVLDHGKITIIGSVPTQTPAAENAVLAFRIEGEVDRDTVRTKSSRTRWPKDGRYGVWMPGISFEKMLKAMDDASEAA